MKRLLALALVLSLLFSQAAWAGEDGDLLSGDGKWRYTVLPDGTAQLTRFLAPEQKIVSVPRTVDGYTVTALAAVFADTDVELVTLPKTVKYLTGTFAGTRLTDLALPDSVEAVGVNPLAYSQVETIHISPSHPTLEYADGLLISRGEHRLIAYCGAAAESECVVPEGVEIIGALAFAQAEGLRRVVLPASVTAIERRAFEGCAELMEVSGGENVARIEEEAFLGCTSLRSAAFGRARVIGARAFEGCAQLETALMIAPFLVEEAAFGSGRGENAPQRLVCLTRAGSALARYCIENGIQWRPCDAAGREISASLSAVSAQGAGTPSDEDTPVPMDDEVVLCLLEDTLPLFQQAQLPFLVRYGTDLTEDVQLIDDSGKVLATLANDGSGRAEGTLSFYETAPRSGTLRAVCGGKRSRAMHFYAHAPVTEEMADALIDVSKGLAAYAAALPFGDLGSGLAIDLAAEYLAHQPQVARVEKDGSAILYLTRDGLVGGYNMPLEEGMRFGTVSAEEAYRAAADQDGLSLPGQYVVSDLIPTNGRLLVLGPQQDRDATDALINGADVIYYGALFADAAFSRFPQVVYGQLEEGDRPASKAETLYLGDRAKEMVLSCDFTDCGLLVLLMHGGVFTKSDGSTLLTMNLGASQQDARLFREYADRLWVDSRQALTDGARGIYNVTLDPETREPVYTFVLTSNYFRNAMRDQTFDNTLVFLEICHAGEDKDFIETLREHGAAAVLSCNGSLDMAYAMMLQAELAESLCYEDDTIGLYASVQAGVNCLEEDSCEKIYAYFSREGDDNDSLYFTFADWYRQGSEWDGGPLPSDPMRALDVLFRSDYGKAVREKRIVFPTYRSGIGAQYVLAGHGAVEGMVVSRTDEGSMAPVEGAEVKFYRWFEHGFREDARFAARTDAEGCYRAPALPFGVWVAEAEYGGQREYVAFTLAADGYTLPEITMRFTLTGRVVTQMDRRQDEPLAQAEVTLTRLDGENALRTRVLTDANGRYRFAVHPGQYLLHASWQQITREIKVTVDQRAREGQAEAPDMRLGYTISGVAIDAQTGQPIPDVGIGTNVRLYHTPVTDAAGEWYVNTDDKTLVSVHFSRVGYRDGEEWVRVAQDESVHIVKELTREEAAAREPDEIAQAVAMRGWNGQNDYFLVYLLNQDGHMILDPDGYPVALEPTYDDYDNGKPYYEQFSRVEMCYVYKLDARTIWVESYDGKGRSLYDEILALDEDNHLKAVERPANIQEQLLLEYRNDRLLSREELFERYYVPADTPQADRRPIDLLLAELSDVFPSPELVKTTLNRGETGTDYDETYESGDVCITFRAAQSHVIRSIWIDDSKYLLPKFTEYLKASSPQMNASQRMMTLYRRIVSSSALQTDADRSLLLAFDPDSVPVTNDAISIRRDNSVTSGNLVISYNKKYSVPGMSFTSIIYIKRSDVSLVSDYSDFDPADGVTLGKLRVLKNGALLTEPLTWTVAADPLLTASPAAGGTPEIQLHLTMETAARAGENYASPAPERVGLSMGLATSGQGSYEYQAQFDAYPTSTSGESFPVFLARRVSSSPHLLNTLAAFGAQLPADASVKPYQSPCRAMVEPLMNDKSFQRRLFLWRLSAKGLTGFAERHYDELDLYRELVFSTLYGGGSIEEIDACAGAVDLFSSIQEFVEDRFSDYEDLTDLHLLTDGDRIMSIVQAYSDEILAANQVKTFGPSLQKYVKYAKAAKTVEMAGYTLTGADHFVRVLERLSEIAQFTEICETRRQALLKISERAKDNTPLKEAIEEYVKIYPTLTNEQVFTIMNGQETSRTLSSLLADKASDLLLSTVPALSLGQSFGSLAANTLFNTDSILSAYSACEAALRFEDLLAQMLIDAREDFLRSPTEENAAYFLDVADMFFRNQVNALSAADEYAQAVMKEGALMSLYKKVLSVEDRTIGLINKRILLINAGIRKGVDLMTGRAGTESLDYPTVNAAIRTAIDLAGNFMPSVREYASLSYYDSSRLLLSSESFRPKE